LENICTTEKQNTQSPKNKVKVRELRSDNGKYCLISVANISRTANNRLTAMVIAMAKNAYQNVFHQRPRTRLPDILVASKYFFHSKK